MEPFRLTGCLDCSVEADVHVLVVTRTNLLDDEAEHLRREFGSVLPAGAASRVVLDLGRVESLSSTGVGALVALLKRVKAHGGELVLCGLSPRVAYVLKLCGLIEDQGPAVFVTAPDAPGALALLRGGQAAA